MMLAGSMITLALAVVVAQGPHGAPKRRRAPASPAATAEKHVAPPARTETATAKRAEPAAAGAAAGGSANSGVPGDAVEGTRDADGDHQAEGGRVVKAAKTKVY